MCNQLGHSADRCFLQLNNKNTKQIEEKKLTCQICQRTGHTATNCFKLMHCDVCNKTGHPTERCYANKARVNATGIICQLCSRPGHSADKCFLLSKDQVESLGVKCQICQNRGHTAANCKDHLMCVYCKTKGHTIEKCRKKQYNDAKRAGNDQSSSVTSAAQGAQKYNSRSTHTTMVQQNPDEFTALDSI